MWNNEIKSRNFYIIEMEKNARRRYIGELSLRHFCFTRQIRRAKVFKSEEEARSFLKESKLFWRNPVERAILGALRKLRIVGSNQAARKLNPYLWRYMVNLDCGGIVIAKDEAEAKRIVKERYEKKYPEMYISDLLVWKVEEDEAFDARYATVMECY